MPIEIETKAREIARRVVENHGIDNPFGAEESMCVAAILAALDSPIGEQGVGALEWRRTETWADAECPVYGRVSVFIRDDLFDWSLNGIVNCRAKCATLDEAIAEIEEERANRILSALSPERKEPVGWWPMDMSSWLIERGDSPPANPRYWCVGIFGSKDAHPARSSSWTENHEHAIRFSREVDARRVADRMMTGHDIPVRVCQHIWIAATPGQPT